METFRFLLAIVNLCIDILSLGLNEVQLTKICYLVLTHSSEGHQIKYVSRQAVFSIEYVYVYAAIYRSNQQTKN